MEFEYWMKVRILDESSYIGCRCEFWLWILIEFNFWVWLWNELKFWFDSKVQSNFHCVCEWLRIWAVIVNQVRILIVAVIRILISQWSAISSNFGSGRESKSISDNACESVQILIVAEIWIRILVVFVNRIRILAVIVYQFEFWLSL